MLSWLVDHASTVYLVLGIAALALVVGWWLSPSDDPRDRPRRRSKRLCLLGLAGVAVLCAGMWILGRTVETDSKRLVGSIEDMAAGVAAKDPDRVFRHISEAFNYQSYNKAAFRKLAEPHIRSGEVEDITLRDFEVKDVSRESRSATVKFWVKATGRNLYNDAGYRCLARFVLERDDRWRVKGLRFTFPHVNPEIGEEVSLPLH